MCPLAVTSNVLGELKESGLVSFAYVNLFFRTGRFAKSSEIEVCAEPLLFGSSNHGSVITHKNS